MVVRVLPDNTSARWIVNPRSQGSCRCEEGLLRPSREYGSGSAWLQDTACGTFGQNDPTRRLASVAGLDRLRLAWSDPLYRNPPAGLSREVDSWSTAGVKQTPLCTPRPRRMFHANRGQRVDCRRGLARLADSILGPYLALGSRQGASFGRNRGSWGCSADVPSTPITCTREY